MSKRWLIDEHCPKNRLDQVGDGIRLKHHFYGTEQAYVDWIKHCWR